MANGMTNGMASWTDPLPFLPTHAVLEDFVVVVVVVVVMGGVGGSWEVWGWRSGEGRDVGVDVFVSFGL